MILTKHAPLRYRRNTDRLSAPWFTLQIKEVKQQRRRAERRWRKSGLAAQRNIHPPQRDGKDTLPVGKQELCVRQDREFFLQ